MGYIVHVFANHIVEPWNYFMQANTIIVGVRAKHNVNLESLLVDLENGGRINIFRLHLRSSKTNGSDRQKYDSPHIHMTPKISKESTYIGIRKIHDILHDIRQMLGIHELRHDLRHLHHRVIRIVLHLLRHPRRHLRILPRPPHCHRHGPQRHRVGRYGGGSEGRGGAATRRRGEGGERRGRDGVRGRAAGGVRSMEVDEGHGGTKGRGGGGVG
mmetsp:Transcript_7204/g.17654  ORF Transcript_7204/g.17654 Transcript_7204/m.17654 type:complete len:214 (-) Transcript_7204:55-696(-)